MVINYINLDSEIDLNKLNTKAYYEACNNNKNLISQLEKADKNFVINALIKSKRAVIRDMVDSSLRCVLSEKYGEKLIRNISNLGYAEIDDFYPIKINFESGLIHAFWKYKITEMSFEKLFNIKYIDSEYLTSDDIDFLKIRKHAIKNYESGNFREAFSSMKFLNEVVDEDFILQFYIGNIYAFYFRDNDNAIEKYTKAAELMGNYNNLIREKSILYYLIGCIYLYEKKYNKSIKYLIEAYKQYEDTEYIYKLAQAYCLCDDKANCIATLKKLIHRNIYYSLEIQYCHNFCYMKKEVKSLIENAASDIVNIYLKNIKEGQKFLSLVDINVQLEGAEDIRDQLLKLKSKIDFNEKSICMTSAYTNIQNSRSYRTLCEIYSNTFLHGLSIKKHIKTESKKITKVNFESDFDNRLDSLNDKYKKAQSCKIKYIAKEKRWRKFFIGFTFCIIILAAYILKWDEIPCAILAIGWFFSIQLLYLFNVFGTKAKYIEKKCIELQKQISNIEEIKAEQWHIKRNIEREIKKNINDMCNQYNNMINTHINDANRKLGLNIEEVKINFV